jgi:hypothetical protein
VLFQRLPGAEIGRVTGGQFAMRVVHDQVPASVSSL